MLTSPNLNKYTNLLQENTPQKIYVQHDINSWLETHQKNPLIYKFKPHRKYLKQQNPLLPPKHSTKKADLAQLKAYKQNLLRSSTKKISQRFQPKYQPSPNLSIKQFQPKIKDINFQVKSTGRPSKFKYQPIVITQFEPNVEQQQQQKQNTAKLNLYLQIKFQQESKSKQIFRRTTSSNKNISATLQRPRKLSTRNSQRAKSQATINLPCKISNPHENGVTLLNRRLVSRKP